ncbi:hypothetical protein [Streptomonospora wellingtoniae]|uniref:hypothetical protein n=1 Tax=Streptomonospora wellingtoniae TaxID=3075544 RepID=UPI002889C3D7|nr:hypothetical protein [Streptomonospora sp. DSM 45055]
MPGYNLWPSDELRQLRADFPDYLIFELHSEQWRPTFIATHTPPAVQGAADVVRADDAEALRTKLSRQPSTCPHPRREGEQS